MRSLIGHLAQVLSGLRFRLLVMLLLACSPLLGLTLYTAFKERHQAMAGWQQRASRYVGSVRREEDSLIDNTQVLLQALAEDSGVRSLNPELALESLEMIHTNYPRYSNFGVATTKGEIVTSVFPVRNSVSRRDLVKAAQRKSSVMGKVPIGFTTTNALVHFAYPVLQKTGVPSAVVFAEIDLTRGTKAPRSPSLPESAVWMEIDENGTVLARYPEPEKWVGTKLNDRWLVTNAFSRAPGLLEASGSSRARMFYSVHTGRSRFANAPRVAFILGTPRHTLFAKADAAMWQNLAILAGAVGVTLGLGFLGAHLLILRPVKALVKSSGRLAAGDLKVRTGLRPTRDELGQLTRAFDTMATALEQRETERQRAAQKLQALSQKLVEVQESERRHIARELHDEIGQSLTAAEMNLQAALRMQASSALERRLEESIKSVERVLEQVHDLSLNLRPSMLDDLGLEPALRWYTHRQASLTGLKTEFRAATLEGRLDPVVETECFRVAQEALTNVVRHAQAHEISVELTSRNGQLHLYVRDDGVGFEVKALRDRAINGASLGLLSMEERASLAGGGLEFNSGPGQGTEVHAWFPLKYQNSIEYSQIND